MLNIKKILIAVLSFSLLFGVSCSNEGTTGGVTGGSISVSEEQNNSYDITVVSSSSSVYSAGTVGFSVYGASGYDVSIQSVDSGSNPLSLEPTDFSYSKSTKELTLSSSGITKLSGATLTEATAYQYTITFKFVDSSDASKEATANVKVNLYKAQVITKTEIEAMVKSIGTVSVPDSSYVGNTIYATFVFSDVTYQSSGANFKANNTGNGTSGKKFSRSTAWAYLSLSKVENYQKYFSGYSYKAPTASGVNLTLYFPLKLKGGYALSSEVAHLTSDGLTIMLSLASGQTWE